MPIKNAYFLCKAMSFVFIYLYKSAKHIIDIRGMSVFECPGDFLDLKPIQED